MVWVAPVPLFLRWHDGVEPFGYLKLRQGIGRGIVIGLGLTALNLLGMCARFGVPHPSLERAPLQLIQAFEPGRAAVVTERRVLRQIMRQRARADSHQMRRLPLERCTSERPPDRLALDPLDVVPQPQ